MNSNSANWQQQAYEYLLQEEYGKAIEFYEKAVEAEPEVKSHYWYLGLLLLLQDQEEEAQTTWLCGMMEGDPEDVEVWTEELVRVLDTEALRRESLGQISLAWLIRQHLREIAPAEINNLLHLLQLAILQETLSDTDLTEWGVISFLEGEFEAGIDGNLLLQTLEKLLQFAPLHPLTLEFAKVCTPYLKTKSGFANVLLMAAIKIIYSTPETAIPIALAELCLQIDENYYEFWGHLACFYQKARNYAQGIEAAKRCFSLTQALPEQIFANYVLIRGLMSAGGYWNEAGEALQQQEFLLRCLIEQPPAHLDKISASRILASSFFFPYVQDVPAKNRGLLNQVNRLCQSWIENHARAKNRYPLGNGRKADCLAGRRLKVGYISHCLNSHSVGWLARWVLQYHDRERFETYGYFISYRFVGDPLQEWYADQVEHCRKIGEIDSLEIAEQIARDEVDILIDLDSLTLDTTCEVMALKPAPIQVTWLGWDGSGLPAIDYYIADPYVLPETAQDYYSEKIWRLPQTYIAVDGFEVGVPVFRREDLNIPADAVVYFSGQTGYKRNPDTARLQMRIIKEVADSYFLIKGQAEEEAIRNFFTQLATEEGVSEDRLRFLPLVASEEIHRATLSLADVVLDTFPYNGATTTLETLWVGIPLVTRVGEQFAARNSYTMMVNAGVTEGIAWTDEEYVDWGIRLGKDGALRQQISWRLWQSRKVSPLWNGKQFTRDLERAYEQMWQAFVEGGN